MRGARAAFLLIAGLTAGCAGAAAGVSISSSQPACKASQLRATYLQPPVAAAGQLVAAVRLDDAGPACRLFGYPGVSLVDGAGHQIGRAATREPAAPAGVRPVSLGPGASAYVELRTERAGVATSCAAPAAVVRVYPPDETSSLEAKADSLRICGGVFVTGPVMQRSPFP
jgi:hypothetical protein